MIYDAFIQELNTDACADARLPAKTSNMRQGRGHGKILGKRTTANRSLNLVGTTTVL